MALRDMLPSILSHAIEARESYGLPRLGIIVSSDSSPAREDAMAARYDEYYRHDYIFAS